MKKIDLLFFLLIVPFLFTNCSSEYLKKNLILPQTGVLSAGKTWATVESSYVVIKDTPLKKGITIGHLRKGDIVTVFGRKTINDTDKKVIWLHLEEGWIPATCCKEYTYEAKAQTESKRLKQS